MVADPGAGKWDIFNNLIVTGDKLSFSILKEGSQSNPISDMEIIYRSNLSIKRKYHAYQLVMRNSMDIPISVYQDCGKNRI